MQSNDSHLGLVLSYFGIMQKDAASAVGVDPAMITRWKNGTERLSANSPRMNPLVGFIIDPKRGISEADLRWLRSRFAEAGINTQLSNTNDLREALANYLANDGSTVRGTGQNRPSSFSEKAFAIQGLKDIVELLESELGLIPNGRPLFVVATGKGIERERACHDAIERAVARGVRVRLLLDTSGSETSELLQGYIPELVNPQVKTRVTSASVTSALQTNMQTTFLVPGKTCLQVTGATKGAPYIACVVREASYVTAAEEGLLALWASASEMFDDPHDTTPRVVSGLISSFYNGPTDIRVSSDGLNPVFMSPDAFGRFLERRDVSESEIRWRVEAFAREHYTLEQHLYGCGSYREMTTALKDLETKLSAHPENREVIPVYGQTFFDATCVDVETAIDILEGYLKFATLNSNFSVWPHGTCPQMSQGLWMISSSTQPPVPAPPGIPSPDGLIVWNRTAEGTRQLASADETLLHAAMDFFDDAWGRIRFRTWHDGRLLTSDHDNISDPSVGVHFIRMEIERLQQLLHDDDRPF